MKTWMLALGLVVAAAGAESVAPVSPETPPRVAAESRVVVTVNSDGETWVSIVNVATPAKFKSKKFSLAPGDYTVVGRRKGYRDVERQLRVRPGETSGALTVICTESM